MTHVLELPPDLETRVKRLVAERGLSRNEFFVDAVEQAVDTADVEEPLPLPSAAVEETEQQRFERIRTELAAYAV